MDITISLTDEEKTAIKKSATDQNFKSIEDFLKFRVMEEVKQERFNEEMNLERDKFEKIEPSK